MGLLSPLAQGPSQPSCPSDKPSCAPDDSSSQSCVARCSLKHFEFEEGQWPVGTQGMLADSPGWGRPFVIGMPYWEPTDGSDEESGLTEDFRGLKAEVEDIGRQLLCMDATLSRKLLGGLAAALRDPTALGALEELVS